MPRLIVNITLIFTILGFFYERVMAFETSATAAIVVDENTGTVLLEKNSEAPLPPASMSKLMTLYMAFEAINQDRLKLDEKLPVSKNAENYKGSTMFLNIRDRVSVEDLLRGIIVLSGNDACAVIAEALSPDGTEAGFAKLMNMKAKTLGLKNSTFKNSNGWPANGHLMSVKDLSLLASKLISDFPEFYPMFSEEEFLFDNRAPANKRNRNPLLKLNIGADGLKTGHTSESGYGLVGSAKRGDRRIIFVLAGLNSKQDRAREAEAIVNWAYRQFSIKSFGHKGKTVIKAPVWNGSKDSTNLTLSENLEILVPISSIGTEKFFVLFESPIIAPIINGDPLGFLLVEIQGMKPKKIALLSNEDISTGGFLTRIKATGFSIFGHLSRVAGGQL